MHRGARSAKSLILLSMKLPLIAAVFLFPFFGNFWEQLSCSETNPSQTDQHYESECDFIKL